MELKKALNNIEGILKTTIMLHKVKTKKANHHQVLAVYN